jgi:DNA-binding NarL/FixJ family response regulator
MPLRILIADNHAVVRRGVRALLESQSRWEMTGEAASGREAVELAEQLQPDIGKVTAKSEGVAEQLESLTSGGINSSAP